MNKNVFMKIETLSKLIFKNLKNTSFTRSDLFIPNRKAIRSKLEKVGIDCEVWDKKLKVNIKNLGVCTFYDEEDFHNFVEPGNTKGDFAILRVNDNFHDFQYYDSKKNQVLKSGEKVVQDHSLSENTVYYFKFLMELRSKIADYDNETRKKIILFGSDGVKILKYPNKPIVWNRSEYIRESCEQFSESLKQEYFQEFFKNMLADFIKNSTVENMIKAIIDNLDTLIFNTDKNIRLYKSKFSYEKLKNEIREQKIKYLKNLRDILGKFIAQVVAVPLSITGTLFAIFQVKDSFMGGFALAAFLIYSVYTIHVQLLYLQEVWDIEEDIEDDFFKIKKDSGLSQSEFENEEKKLISKLKTAKSTIRIFVGVIIVLTFVFLIAVASLHLIKFLIVSISAISYILLIFARIYFHFKQVKYSDKEKEIIDEKKV